MTAGFLDVVAVRVDAPLRLATAAECVQFERDSFGALHQMLAGLDESGARRRLGRDRASGSRPSKRRDGFVGPCELVVVAGTAPGGQP